MWLAIDNRLSMTILSSHAERTMPTVNDKTGTSRTVNPSMLCRELSHSTCVLLAFGRSRLALIQTSTTSVIKASVLQAPSVEQFTAAPATRHELCAFQSSTENISIRESVNHGALWLFAYFCALEILLLTYLQSNILQSNIFPLLHQLYRVQLKISHNTKTEICLKLPNSNQTFYTKFARIIFRGYLHWYYKFQNILSVNLYRNGKNWKVQFL